MRIRESVANRSRICANRVEDFRESVANLRKPTQNCCIPMQICANSFENFRESVANLREFIAYLCKCVQTHSRTFANLSRICVTSCVVLRQMPRIPYTPSAFVSAPTHSSSSPCPSLALGIVGGLGHCFLRHTYRPALCKRSRHAPRATRHAPRATRHAPRTTHHRLSELSGAVRYPCSAAADVQDQFRCSSFPLRTKRRCAQPRARLQDSNPYFRFF